MSIDSSKAHQRIILRRKIRQGLGIFGFFAVIIAIVAGLAYARGAPSGYSEPSAEVLATLTEVEQAQASGRRDVPSALDNKFDDSFPEALVSPALVLSGGPPPDGIPAIDRPFFERIDQIDWLDDREPVIVLTLKDSTGQDITRAYPVQVLTWHEIVNDTVAGRAVVVSYCPLCNSAIAFERRLPDGDVLDFGTSGSLLHSAMVMFDRQTESLWAHFTGEAIIGALAGTTLPLLPVATVSYGELKSSFPDALVLSQTTGFGREYGQTPYPGYDDVNSRPFLFSGEVEGPLLAKTRVLALRAGTDSVAVPLKELATAGVTTIELDGSPVVLLHTAGTTSALDERAIVDSRDVGATGVFVAADSDGVALDLRFDVDRPGLFRSTDGTDWNVLGVAVSGPRAGDRLESVEHVDTFWFAIVTYEPDTRIVHP
jgi:hypothetical protein